MALLKKVKSLLGLAEEGETETSDDQGDVGVTVEREPEAEPGTSDEPAGTPPETGIDEEPEGTEGPGPEVNEPPETAEPVSEQGEEPIVDADAVGDDPDVDAEPDDPVVEAEPERADDPVVEIKGIGPSYADRLGEAGIETVSDLAAADAEEVGDATGISPKRVEAWIDRAKAR